MPELPKTIRVGYRDYRVEDWPAREASAAGKLGFCDRDNALIRVADGYDRQLTAECLLHEVLHAIYHMGCVETNDDEERVVSVFGNLFTQVWRDNPDFVAFMSESLNPDDPDFPSEAESLGEVVAIKPAA